MLCILQLIVTIDHSLGSICSLIFDQQKFSFVVSCYVLCVPLNSKQYLSFDDPGFHILVLQILLVPVASIFENLFCFFLLLKETIQFPHIVVFGQNLGKRKELCFSVQGSLLTSWKFMLLTLDVIHGQELTRTWSGVRTHWYPLLNNSQYEPSVIHYTMCFYY